MRIPEYYKYRGWQVLFAGMALGCIISWCVFLFMYGTLQEKQLFKIEELQMELQSLKKDKEILIENIKETNQENHKKLVVQNIEISILNAEDHKLDILRKLEIKKMIEDDMDSILTKNIENVSTNLEFIIKTIENRDYKFEDFTYSVKVSRISLSSTLKIDLEILSVNRN